MAPWRAGWCILLAGIPASTGEAAAPAEAAPTVVEPAAPEPAAPELAPASAVAPATAALTPEVATAFEPAYELVGHGYCLDARGKGYEQWYLPDWQSQALVYHGNLSNCACPECYKVCDEFLVCAGFQYFCCQYGERCFGGGAILFGKRKRPDVAPPGNFSVVGPRDSNTAGPGYEGTGTIVSATDGVENQYCYKKLGGTVKGFIYEPHTMQGTTKTLEATWQACQTRCIANPYCETWGFWPDHGCHLQGTKTTLVKAACDNANKTACPGLGVISGGRTLESSMVTPEAAAAEVARSAAAAAAHAAEAAEVAGGTVEHSREVAAPDRVSQSAAGGMTLEEEEFQVARGVGVLVLILVVAGLALYLVLQDGWSKKRKKKRRIEQTRRQREAEAERAWLEGDRGSSDEGHDNGKTYNGP